MNNENMVKNQNGLSQDELAHYGILGMKWGVRRTEAQLARLGKRVDKLKAKKKQQDKLDRAKKKLDKLMAEEESLKSALKKKPKKVKEEKEPKPEKVKPVKKKKKISELTDDELRSVINRIEMEKKYKELTTTKETKKKIFDGRSFLSNVLQRSGEELGTQVVKYAGAKAINKILDDEAVFANNKKK